MEENLSTVNAGQEANVEPQNTGTTNVQETGVSEGVTNTNSAPAPQKPVQDAQTNAQFAEMRRARETAEAKAAKLERDMQIARQYGQYGIFTEEDYQTALAEQEARNMGVDPQFYQEFNNMKSQLGTIQREKTLMEQDNNLKNDPIRGNLYKQWESEVKQVATRANVDYRTAFNYLLDQKLPDLLNSQKTAGQQEAIRSITQNAQTSPGALGEGAGIQKVSPKDMPKKDFDDMIDRVKRGEKIYL